MELLRQVKEEYNGEIRLRKEAFRLRRARILEEIPQIILLRGKINRLWMSCIAGDISQENCERQTEELEGRITRALESSGYEANVLEYRPRCALCEDKGYVGRNMCACLRQKYIDACYNQSNVRTLLEKENFSTFSLDRFSSKPIGGKLSPRDNMAQLREKALRFLEEFDQTAQSLLFIGPCGTGKSFLSHCIARELVERGKTVLYITAYDLVEKLTDVSLGRLEREACNLFWNCDLIIIDDLGCERRTDYAQGQLFNLINERLLREKKMLVSTNLSSAELRSNYDERIFSRIIGNFTGYSFYGEDLRLTKRVKQN